MKLQDAVVIVTGASQGLGRAFAKILVDEGAIVICCSRNSAKIGLVASEFNCEGKALDVENYVDVSDFIKDVVATHKKIDVVINNAGAIHKKVNLENIDFEEYHRTINTNLTGVFNVMKFTLPVMKKQNSGIIVNISSGAGSHGHPGMSAYAASKHAVNGLTKSVAMEVESTPIKCLTISPGGTNTPMRAAAFGEDDANKQQSADFVAQVLRDVLTEKISVPNGGDISVRHGEVGDIIDNLAR